MYTSSITQKGQTTIPADLRKKLGINPGDKVFFTQKDNKIVIEPLKDFLSLKGSIKSKETYTDKIANKKILDLKKTEYEQKSNS